MTGQGRKIGESLLKLFRGDFVVFLFFLILTFFFWWSQTMSQDDQTVLKIPLQVTDVPDDVRITTPPVGQVSVSLNGKRSALLKSGRRGSKHVLYVNNGIFSMNRGHASLSTQWLRDSIAAMLPASVQIKAVEPDSIIYRYVGQRIVMLPVVFNGVIESQDQFFAEHVEFTPDSICARVLETDTMPHSVMANVGTIVLSADTTVMTLPVSSVEGVLLRDENVRMTIVAQQYTEKSLEVPVTGVNFPAHIALKSFPSKAVVTAWVRMSDYDRVSASDFQVVVDYNDISGNDNSKAVPRIYSQPANVRNVRLQTRSVDYLMETKLY